MSMLHIALLSIRQRGLNLTQTTKILGISTRVWPLSHSCAIAPLKHKTPQQQQFPKSIKCNRRSIYFAFAIYIIGKDETRLPIALPFARFIKRGVGCHWSKSKLSCVETYIMRVRGNVLFERAHTKVIYCLPWRSLNPQRLCDVISLLQDCATVYTPSRTMFCHTHTHIRSFGVCVCVSQFCDESALCEGCVRENARVTQSIRFNMRL